MQNSYVEVEAEIRALEEKTCKAMQNNDVAVLQQLWAEDFLVNAPTNTVNLGSHVIDLIRKGVIKYSSFTRTIEQVMVKQGIVITMGSEHAVKAGDMPEADQTVNRRCTHIWMSQNGNWRLVARHANDI